MHKLPVIPQLLVQGGDERIALAADTGANKYGVSPHPQPRRIEFSSSTASHVSPAAWSAIERFRMRVNQELPDGNAAGLWRLEAQRIRQEFMQIWGLDGRQIQWQLHRSGTDAHAMAAALACRRFGRPFRIVMGEFAETGSRIPLALLNGSREHGCAMAEIREVPIRNLDGACRSAKAIDQDFYRAAVEALAQDMPVLLIRVDESKSGAVFPSLDLVSMLAAKSPGHVAVLADCSQLRCGAEALAQYLDADFMVALTGSKYFGAPAFCGALLGGPGWRPDWPADAADTDENGQPNFAMLARWEAALYMMGRHQRIPAVRREEALAGFHAAVQRAVAGLPALELLDALRDGRGGDRSLFAVRGVHRYPRRSLSHAEVERVYRGLSCRPRGNGNIYALGQPVPCGGKDYLRTQYLRVSLSAQMLIDVCRMPQGEGAAWLDHEVSSALHALSEEISHLP